MAAHNGNRKLILQAVFDGCRTRSEIIKATGLETTQVRDGLKTACQEELLCRHVDDVEQAPGYRLTPAGRRWLMSDGAKPGRKPAAAPKKPKAPETPVVVAHFNDSMAEELRLWTCLGAKYNVRDAEGMAKVMDKIHDEAGSLMGENMRLRAQLQARPGAKGYMVSVDGRHAPSLVHPTEEAARDEAERLSKGNPSITLRLFALLDVLRPVGHRWESAK